MSRRGWRQAAVWVGLAVLAGTPVVAFFGITIGVVTGLLVLILPAYVVAVWAALVVEALALCLWRGHRAWGRGLATTVALAPVLALTWWFVSALVGCTSEADPRACAAYYTDGPLLPFLIAGSWTIGLAATAGVWLASDGQPRPAPDGADPGWVAQA